MSSIKHESELHNNFHFVGKNQITLFTFIAKQLYYKKEIMLTNLKSKPTSKLYYASF